MVLSGLKNSNDCWVYITNYFIIHNRVMFSKFPIGIYQICFKGLIFGILNDSGWRGALSISSDTNKSKYPQIQRATVPVQTSGKDEKVVSLITLIFAVRLDKLRIYTIYNPPESELLKVADMQMHVCTKILSICTKFVLLNAKQEKLALVNNFGTILQNSLRFHRFFNAILSPLFCAKCLVRNYCLCKKNLTLRRSALR